MENDNKHILLNDCSNVKDNEESSRIRIINEILKSSDYGVLQNSNSIRDSFLLNYSVDKLKKLNLSELENRKRLLHKLISFQDQLQCCINSGNGPKLSSEDVPNFTSENSITRLLNKISLSTKKTNYTNIDSNNALVIFDDSTVKSAQTCFDLLPVSITKNREISESDISNYFSDTFYCVNISEFTSIHVKFLEMSENANRVIFSERILRRKRILFKIAVILFFLGTIFAFSLFEIIAGSYTLILGAVAIAVAILYLIWG